MTYCSSCDKKIIQKFIKKHNKSKSHLYFHNNFVTNKHYINNIQWKNFENAIRDYIDEYNSKFNYFLIKIDFQLSDDKYNITVNNIERKIALYKFGTKCMYYKICPSKKVRDFVFHNTSLKNIKLESTSIIINVILKIFSKYKSMKRYHLLSQTRPVLESKILKQIHNSKFIDKLTKYKFLANKYEL